MCVRFASRYANHRIVLEPVRPDRDPSGNVVGLLPGKDIQFQGHVYETDDPEEIEALRALPGFGQEIMEVPEDFEVYATGPEVGGIVSTATVMHRGRGRPRKIGAEGVPVAAE